MKRRFDLESMHTIAMIAVFGTMFLMAVVTLGLMFYLEFSSAKLELELKAQALKKDPLTSIQANPPAERKEGSCAAN